MTFASRICPKEMTPSSPTTCLQMQDMERASQNDNNRSHF